MISFRKATIEDLELFFDWANDEEVRKNSYQNNAISFDDHVRWYLSKVNSAQSLMLVFFWEKTQEPFGQIRFEQVENKESIISISISKQYRGKGLAARILKMACQHYLSQHPDYSIIAYIKSENQASYQSFQKAGFYNKQNLLINGIQSYQLLFP